MLFHYKVNCVFTPCGTDDKFCNDLEFVSDSLSNNISFIKGKLEKGGIVEIHQINSVQVNF